MPTVSSDDEVVRFRAMSDEILREQFRALPPAEQRATIARVREKLQRAHPQSALWRYARLVCGLDVRPQ